MRPDANRLALRTVRKLLDAARPVEVDVAGVRVTCAASRTQSRAWPANGVTGLDEEADGPWPQEVNFECTWPGGKCSIVARAQYVRAQGRYRHHVALELSVRDNNQQLVWINLAKRVDQTADGKSFRLHGNIYLSKNKDPANPSGN